MAHLADQGVPGFQQATIVGLVLGALYIRARDLWLPIVAHAAFDLVALAILYLGLESAVARSIFG